jgi:hypothetical protein
MTASGTDQGAAIAASLVEDLMAPVDDLAAPATLPRSVTWRPAQNGLLIVTDQATVLVPIERSDEFARMMRALIHPGFKGDVAGNC